MRTCRRQLIDKFLEDSTPYFTGTVLDIGGKKTGKRGVFRPVAENVKVWLYLNIDTSSGPDILASAKNIPLENETIDAFLMCEVLEHVAEPEACLAEAARVLKPGGHGLITVPFLYPIHADPFDFQRWTGTRLSLALDRAGLNILELKPMGGPLAVVSDILQIWTQTLRPSNKLLRFVCFAFLSIFKRIFVPEKRMDHLTITTGFAILVQKPQDDFKGC